MFSSTQILRPHKLRPIDRLKEPPVVADRRAQSERIIARVFFSRRRALGADHFFGGTLLARLVTMFAEGDTAEADVGA